MRHTLRFIEIDRIEPNHRYVCDIDSIEAMAANIRRSGQIAPVELWFTGRCLRICDGEKRWRACKKLGHRLVAAIIVDRYEDNSAQ